MTRSLLAAMLLSMVVALVLPAAGGARAAIPTVLLPVASSPLVTLRVQFRAGAANDPAGKQGLTRLTAMMMARGGTRTLSYEQITERLYPMAAGIDVTVDKELTTFVGTTHIENLDAYLELFMQVLLEPGFVSADFERLRENQSNYLTSSLRGSNDEELGKESLNTMIYEGHPYGTPDEGTVASVASITLEDVRTHCARVFTRSNVTVGLAGGYPAALPDRVTRALEKLPEAKALEPAYKLTAPEGIEVLAVEKDCLATAISIGYAIDVTRASPDFYALLVANSHLGEHRTFNGRLMNRMREVRGLNYGDYSYIEHFVQDGGSTFPLTNHARTQQYFSIWIRPVQHAQRHFALRLAMWELERLVRNGMTQEEFETTRTFLKSYSKLWAQNQSQRLGYAMDSRFYGTDDYLSTLPARLDALTLEQVNAAVKKHLRYDRLHIAVVTRGADEFLTALIENTASPITYDAGSMPDDVLAEDKLVSVYKLTINRAASRIVDVEQMFK